LITQLKVRDLDAWRYDAGREAPLLVDVREPWEHEHARIDGARLIPLQSLPTRAAELPRDRDLVLVCHHGARSQRAAQWLEQAGYARLYNLVGGVDAWSCEIDPGVPRY
jgi:rhodanese-related sulfurtransferase